MSNQFFDKLKQSLEEAIDHQNTYGSIFDGECWCYDCDQERRDKGEIGPLEFRMNLCPDCGNKRCPKATNHNHHCSNSNEPEQEGSRY